MMKNVLRVLLVVALVLVVATMGLAAATMTTPSRVGAGPGAISVTERTMNMKVMDVNQSARTVTLQMPNGTSTTFRVGSEVRNLGQLKKGDMIRATVLDSTAVYIQKAGARPSATEMRSVTLSPRGGKPGMVTANTIRMTGKIQSIDTQNRMITVMGPGNRTRTFRVSPNVDLRNLKTGEDIVLRHTEAMLINLQRTTAR